MTPTNRVKFWNQPPLESELSALHERNMELIADKKALTEANRELCARLYRERVRHQAEEDRHEKVSLLLLLTCIALFAVGVAAGRWF